MYLTVAQPSQPALSILLGHIDGAQDREQHLPLKWANRHLVLTGATGTGKTETLKTIVSGFALAGVPCFLPDVKGDLDVISRVAPTRFWDISGQDGEEIAVSIRDMGATLFARMLGLNDTQQSVIKIVFALARKFQMPLDTFDDLRAVLAYIDLDENKESISARYGHIDNRTMGIIRRALLDLEEENADQFFGPTTFSLDDLMETHQGKGVVSLLRAKNLMQNPVIYSTFLVWLLNELFVKLPEVGDSDKPKLVFFFDEAHMLFDDAPKAFVQMVEKVVRLIRSKGVSVNFVSQTLADIPEAILAQLTTIIQHRLSARTPRERKGLQAAADGFSPNPKIGPISDAICSLGTGWALVSVLDEHGVPTVVEKTRIRLSDIPASGPVIESPPRTGPVLVVDNDVKPVQGEPSVLPPEAIWAALGEFQGVSPDKMARVRAYLHEAMAARDGSTYGNRLEALDGEQPSVMLETTGGEIRIRLASAVRAEEFLIPVEG